MVSLQFSDLLSLTLLAWAGAGHCAGMCGGFALMAAAPATRGGIWRRLAVYQVTKTLSYVFLGLVMLAALELLVSRTWIETAQRFLSYGVAVALAVSGSFFLFGWRLTGPWERWLVGAPGCGPRLQLGGPGNLRAGVVGWLNGLLPCGLTLAAIVYLLRFRAVGELVLGLVWFGLATVPVMAALVWVGGRVAPERRRSWLRWGGAALLAGAALTLVRALPGAHAWVREWAGDPWWLPPPDPWCS